MKASYVETYGRWAVVAGASEGLGAAFAETLAKRGCNLILIARREGPLDELSSALRRVHGVDVRAIVCDLADGSFIGRIREVVGEVEIGVGVYNAAFAPVGSLLQSPLEEALRVVDVNVRGPLIFAHSLAPAMVARKRGALVLMSSLAGFHGAPRLAAYGASKAFITLLGESLWADLRPRGVDLVVSCPGAIRTPGYSGASRREAPGTLDPDQVVEATLGALGKGPIVIPGSVNKVATFLLGRVLSRRAAALLMARSTADLE